MNPATVAALRTTFLYTFDNFAVSPTEVADLPEIGNVRYARELLGLLQAHNLVHETDVNGEEMVWQTVPVNIDDTDHAGAEAVIDEFLATFEGALVQEDPAAKPARRSKPSKANPAGLPLCLCGCGLAGKSDYRPGHDARHAGNLARAILSGEMAVNVATKGLSEALRAKVLGQVERGNNKAANATSAKSRSGRDRHSLIGQAAWVKVGRWIKTGEVTSVTVDARGKETANSEVCVIEYKDAKGDIKHAQVDVAGALWGMGEAPGR